MAGCSREELWSQAQKLARDWRKDHARLLKQFEDFGVSISIAREENCPALQKIMFWTADIERPAIWPFDPGPGFSEQLRKKIRGVSEEWDRIRSCAEKAATSIAFQDLPSRFLRLQKRIEVVADEWAKEQIALSNRGTKPLRQIAPFRRRRIGMNLTGERQLAFPDQLTSLLTKLADSRSSRHFVPTPGDIEFSRFFVFSIAPNFASIKLVPADAMALFGDEQDLQEHFKCFLDALSIVQEFEPSAKTEVTIYKETELDRPEVLLNRRRPKESIRRSLLALAYVTSFGRKKKIDVAEFAERYSGDRADSSKVFSKQKKALERIGVTFEGGRGNQHLGAAIFAPSSVSLEELRKALPSRSEKQLLPPLLRSLLRKQ